MKLSQKTVIWVLLLLLALGGLLLPQHTAQAGPAGWLFNASFNAIITQVQSFVLNLTGQLIGWFAYLLDSLVNYAPSQGEGVYVVSQSWTVIRNFVNLFFILVLIVMAFGTIFDNEKYGYRRMLGPFLISALLINFSLVIGQYIIGIANGLSSIFLKQIGQVSVVFGKGSQIAQFATTANVLDASGGLIVTGIAVVVLLVGFLLAMASAAIFVLVRIFVLWFLLIISPIAWLGYAFPYLKGVWDDWWKHFLCWCFFLPYFLFFTMFAALFIANKDSLQNLPPPTSALSQSVTLNDFFLYALSLTFLFGGTIYGKKMACASGAGVGKVFGKIESGVRNYMPGSRYARSVYTGATAGLKAKGEEIKERGLPIPGTGIRMFSEQEARLREAKVAEKFGFGSLRGQVDKVALAEANKENEKIRQAIQAMAPKEREDYLKQEMANSGARGNAAALEFAKQGYSTLADYQKMVGRFGGEYTSLSREYLKNIKEAKFSQMFTSADEEVRIAKGEHGAAQLVELRRALAQDLAEKNRITTEKDYQELKSLFEPLPREMRTFMNAIKPEFIYATRQARQGAILQGRLDNDPDLARKLIDFMKEKKEISAQRNPDGSVVPDSDTKIRNKVLEILGAGNRDAGKNTIEGRNIINEIDKFNPIINIRADNPGLTGNALIAKITKELEGKVVEDVAKYSSDLFEDPAGRAAVIDLISRDIWDDEFLQEVTKKASGKVKKQLKDIKNALGRP